MDAHVERRQALGDHPFEVGLGETGERGEVAVEERQPKVVVLQGETLPHALRQLIDEAERAVVVAGSNLVEERRLHLDAERCAVGLLDLDDAFETCSLDVENDRGFVDQQLILDDVAGLLAVDRAQDVADEHPGLSGGRVGNDSNHGGKSHRRSLRPCRWVQLSRSSPG